MKQNRKEVKGKTNIGVLDQMQVPKALLKLGIPTMIGMMVSALYNLVDTYFVGMLGTSQQAAVAAVFPISMIMLGVGLLFGSGGGSYLARLLGQKRQKEADECASTAVALATVTAIILVGTMLIFINPILRLLGCTDTMLPYARDYAIPFISGLVINVFNSCLSNLSTNEGQPMYSMRAMLIGGLANMILDPIMIFTLQMGVAGAAMATLIGRLFSLTSYVLFLLSKKSCIHYSVRNIRLKATLLMEIIKIGIPMCAYQILCSVALSLMNNQAKSFGDSAIAAAGIVSRILTMGMMTIMGFMRGYQTFVGFNYGAGNYKRVKNATNTAVLWSTVFCVICSLCLIVFRVPLVQAFNPNDEEVLVIGSKAIVYNAISFLTVGYQLVYSCKFMGLGKAVEGGLVSLGRQGFFFIPVIFLLTGLFGLTGLLLAQPVADLMSMVLVVILAIKNNKEEKSLIMQKNANVAKETFVDCPCA